jgi:signal transduction histidine kinase
MFHKTNATSEPPWLGTGTIGLPALRELCHDVTAPAASIKLLAEVAAAESDPGPAALARLRQIADEAGKIAQICGYVLDQSHGGSTADLHTVAAETADSFRWRYPGVIDVTAEPVTVAAHPVAVVRILSNLLENACRAAGAGGRVLLTAEHDGDQARLVIADSGPGFGRGEPGKASLGLNIVAATVRRAGGSLRMGSSDLGGLAVTVTFPGARGTAAPEAGGFGQPREVAG